jgi:hypothetical protein
VINDFDFTNLKKIVVCSNSVILQCYSAAAIVSITQSSTAIFAQIVVCSKVFYLCFSALIGIPIIWETRNKKVNHHCCQSQIAEYNGVQILLC